MIQYGFLPFFLKKQPLLKYILPVFAQYNFPICSTIPWELGSQNFYYLGFPLAIFSTYGHCDLWKQISLIYKKIYLPTTVKDWFIVHLQLKGFGLAPSIRACLCHLCLHCTVKNKNTFNLFLNSNYGSTEFHNGRF